MRIGIFVDCAALNRSCQMLLSSKRLDFNKLAKLLTPLGEVTKMVAFVKHMENGHRESQSKFDTVLVKSGYTVRTKVIADKDASDAKATSWNVGITLAVIDSMSEWDTAVLGVQDAGMTDLVKYLVHKKKSVYVVGFKESTGFKLIKHSKKFIPLDSTITLERKGKPENVNTERRTD